MQEIAEKLRLVKRTVLLFAHSQNKSQLEFIWPVKFPFSLVPPSKKEKFIKIEFEMVTFFCYQYITRSHVLVI